MTTANPYADFSKMFEPVQKLVDLNVAKFDEVVAAQTAASKSFVEQAEAQFKTASGIKGSEEMAAFLKEQTEVAKENMEKLIADSKNATEEMIAYSQEVQKILSESVETIKPAAPAKKSTAKKTA